MGSSGNRQNKTSKNNWAITKQQAEQDQQEQLGNHSSSEWTKTAPNTSGDSSWSSLPRVGEKQIGCPAPGSDDNSIRLWDVQNGKEIQSADKKYKDILAKFKAPLFSNNPLPESNNITILRISQTPLFQAQGALILKGEFINYEGYDLRSLFKSLGSCILEDLNQK
ncbi:unnamed protein product [Paramecium pentaurelia]|uniref:Uncharacterized protein n=1 Tax=Paramecium pentaurelia TaxID=43138 RepID=A0A8S1WG31_9CILI|nr:unnamed protein product [Paramecium pentaurelia]